MTAATYLPCLLLILGTFILFLREVKRENNRLAGLELAR